MTEPLDRRIERVVQGVLPESHVEGELAAPRPLDERMAFHRTPGVSVAVINDFEVEWTRGFGLRKAGASGAVTPTTLFQAGSISKPTFALAVMRLVEDGRLDLDEDVNQYLTSWRVPAVGSWQPRVTLRHLLSHTAGTTVHGFPGYQATEHVPTLIQVLDGELPANTNPVRVNILPGVQFRYSGGGTSIAQQVVIDVLKKPFPIIMRELVLGPLGMTNSTYEQPLPAEQAESAATGHPENGIPLVSRFHTYPQMAAAGLWTTPADLAKLGVALMHTLNNMPSSSFLRKDTVEAMLQPQLPDQKEDEDHCGLGFFCQGKGEGAFFGHDGGNDGFVAVTHFYRQVGKGAVVMVNSNVGFELLFEMLRAIAREYEWPEFLPKPKTAVGLAAPGKYAGTYSTPEGITFAVVSQDGNVALHYGQQPPLPLLASSELKFFAQGLNTNVTFEKDDTGQVTALTLEQEGKRIRAIKPGQIK